MNRLRASRIGVAWLFLAGLVSAALIPLAGCGGETGGITSGVGGALLNVRVQTFVATVSVGSGGSDGAAGLPGVIAAIGRDNNGQPFAAFDLILKGASYDSQDVVLPFQLANGDKLFKVKQISDNAFVDRAAFKREGKYFFADLGSNEQEEEVDLTLYSIDETVFFADAFRFVSDTTPILRRGTYDVVLAFKTDAAPSNGDNLREYWRVYYQLGATIDPSTSEVALRPEVDAALTYSKAASVSVEVKNISPSADAVLVRLKELPIRGETAATFEVLQPVTNPSPTMTIEVPLINRLRGFLPEVEVQVISGGKGNAIAWYPNHLARDANGTADNATDRLFEIPVESESFALGQKIVEDRLQSIVISNTQLSIDTAVDLGTVKARGYVGGSEAQDELFDVPREKIVFIAGDQEFIGSVAREGLKFRALTRPTSGAQLATATFGLDVTATKRVTASAQFDFDPGLTDGFVKVKASAFPAKTQSVVFTVRESGGNRKFLETFTPSEAQGQNARVPVVDRSVQFISEAEAKSKSSGEGFVLAKATQATPVSANGSDTSLVTFGVGSDRVDDVALVQIGGSAQPVLKRSTDYTVVTKLTHLDVFQPEAPYQILNYTYAFDGLAVGQTPIPLGEQGKVTLRDGVLSIGNIANSETHYYFRLTATYTRADGGVRTRTITCKINANKGTGDGEIKIGGGR